MYYEETWIGGWLHWRSTPDGKWIKADAAKLNWRLHQEIERRKDEALEASFNDR